MGISFLSGRPPSFWGIKCFAVHSRHAKEASRTAVDVARRRHRSRVNFAVAFFALAFLAAAQPALADYTVQGACYAAPGRALNPIWSAFFPTVKPETVLAVTFTNYADVPLTDLRVHYDFLDAFGEVIDSLDGVWSGSFAPNVFINFGPDSGGRRLEKPPLPDASQVKDIRCYISGARWSDGTVRTFASSGATSTNTTEPPPSASDANPGSATTNAGQTGTTNSGQTNSQTRATLALPTPATTGQMLFDLEGNGIKTTQRLQVPDEWAIAWSYDCSGFNGGNGMFVIWVQGDKIDLVANQLTASGHDVSYEHSGGSIYLKIISECAWHVRVVAQ